MSTKSNWIIGLFLLVIAAVLIVVGSYWKPSFFTHFGERSVRGVENTTPKGVADMLDQTKTIDETHQQIESNAALMEELDASINQLSKSSSALEQSEQALLQLELTLDAAELASQQLGEQNTVFTQEPIDVEGIPSIEEVEEMYQAYRDKQLTIGSAQSAESPEYVMPPEVLEKVENTTGISGSEIEALMNQ